METDLYKLLKTQVSGYVYTVNLREMLKGKRKESDADLMNKTLVFPGY